LSEVVTILRLQGVHIEAQDVAILRTGLNGFRGTDGEPATEQQLVGRVPL
jgi:hypothetical protein